MLAYSAYAFAEDWGTSGVLAAYWQPILWVIVAVLLARAATVYGLSWTGRDIPRFWTHIMFWVGCAALSPWHWRSACQNPLAPTGFPCR